MCEWCCTSHWWTGTNRGYCADVCGRKMEATVLQWLGTSRGICCLQTTGTTCHWWVWYNIVIVNYITLTSINLITFHCSIAAVGESIKLPCKVILLWHQLQHKQHYYRILLYMQHCIIIYFCYSYKWYKLCSKVCRTTCTLLKLPLLWQWIITNGLFILLIIMYSFLSYWCCCEMCWKHGVR